MSKFRLLIVEDHEQELKVCRDTVVRYQDEKKREVDLIECRSVDEAFKKLDNSYDGAIIDLKLDKQGNEGNLIVRHIEELHLRLPVAILTGTPDSFNFDLAHIGVFKKGETGAGYADLLDRFWEIHITGLTRIMGGRGIIEKTLSSVFKKSLLPQIKKWAEYGQEDPDLAEKALLRHTLNHLMQLLDDDNEKNFPEEMYLYPPITDQLRTGSIIKKKSVDQKFVVMNPICDLVIRPDGNCNTDRILIVEIDSQALLFPCNPSTGLSGKQKGELKRAFKNNNTIYHHWLPATNFFEGGFLNFRKLFSLTTEEIKTDFEKSEVQISPSFVKNITSRFSAYYARQGQPEIAFKDI